MPPIVSAVQPSAKLSCSKRVRKASKQGRSTSARKRLKLERWVQRFTVVDNSYCSANRLTALVTLLILASQGRSPCFPFQTARILMALHVFVYVFLLAACLLLSLALFWRLDWFRLRPSPSRGEAKRTTLQRLLKPRSPDDCPA